jgi:hypothetical protein
MTITATATACRCSLVVTEGGERTGCTKTVTRAFAPGHDAKLKSLLGLAQANSEAVIVTIPGESDTDPNTEVEMSPLEAAGRFGNFGYMVVQIAAKITAKRDRAAAHKAKLAANAEARASKKKAAKVALPVQKAKVGRWEYEGVVKADRFVYTNKKGETVAAERFQLV